MTGKHRKKTDRPGLDRLGRTGLHYAALDGRLDDVRSGLQSGLDPNSKDDDGCTPLHFATQSNKTDISILLVNFGAYIDAQDSNGNTPLSNAVFYYDGTGELIRILRSLGANPCLENNFGVSPLKLARDIANSNVAIHFQDLP